MEKVICIASLISGFLISKWYVDHLESVDKVMGKFNRVHMIW